MVTVPAWKQDSGNGWSLVDQAVRTEGSATHPHRQALVAGPGSLRDLGDVVHALCAVHGSYPGVADEAASRAVEPKIAAWLRAAAEGMATERSFLARLASVAGPVPSTPGQARTEAALAGQRHALTMLGRSDRRGCAAGAVAALTLDWLAIRPVLDLAADQFGVTPVLVDLPLPTETASALAGMDAGAERATSFGAQQMIAQICGAWDLLEARASARG